MSNIPFKDGLGHYFDETKCLIRKCKDEKDTIGLINDYIELEDDIFVKYFK